MSSDPRIGTELGGYRIERVLGRGGMSIVYLAEHLRLHRKVALKVLSPELSGDEAFRTRFLRESELAASLDHPNIIPIFEAGEAADVSFIAMRYVKTTDLAVLIDELGPLPLARTASIVEQAASALDAAHVEGLVHRDVKPANLLIATGTGPGGADHVYLSDFGLTKHSATKSGLTRTGAFMGTLDYVPPEQIKGQALDGRSDQYALACVLFQCLTARVPFDRPDEAAVLFAHLSEPPPSVSALRDDLPTEIDAVIARGMSKEPDERFPTCSALAGAARATLGAALRSTAPPISSAPTVLAAPPEGDATDPTRVAAPVAEPTAATSVGETRLAPPPAETGRPPAPPPAPAETPPPDGARGRRRALIVGLLAAAAVLTILVLLLAPFGNEPEAGEASTGVTGQASPTDEVSPAEPAVNPLVGRWEARAPDGSLVQLTIRGTGNVRLTTELARDCPQPGFASLEGIGEFQTSQARDQLVLRDVVAECRLGSEIQISELILEHDPATDTVIDPNDPAGGALRRVEEFSVNPLVGAWEGTTPSGSTARITIRRDGSMRSTDDGAVICSPPGLIVVDEVGRFGTRQGRNRLTVRNAAATCADGLGGVTIPELIIEHDPDTDTVRSVNEPPPGTVYERV